MNTASSAALTMLLHPELAALVETVRLGTVSAAAESLGISQPAMSARLARLSETTGGSVFTRQGRLLKLTNHGALVHDGALRVLRSCEAMQSLLQGAGKQESPLRVGTTDAVPKIVVRRVLAPYFRAGHRIQCREWASDHLERELIEHRLDLLITDREPFKLRSEDLETRQTGQSKIVWCARPALAKEIRANFPRSLENARLALPATPSPLRERLDRWLSRHAPQAQVVIEAEDRSLLHHFAQAEQVVIPVAVTTLKTLSQQFGVVKIAEAKGVEESYFSVLSRWRLPALEQAGVAGARRVL